MKISIKCLIALQILLCTQNTEAFSQKRLHVGDKVPDLIFTSLYNYPLKTAKLSDFRGKLLILDFWNMGCSSCISAMPKMELLQQQFDDRIQVLLVNSLNNSRELKKLGFPERTRAANIRNSKLPFVIDENKELLQLFEHGPEPFHVWIDKDGKILALTDGLRATVENVKSILEGRQVRFPTILLNEDYDLSPNRTILQKKNLTHVLPKILGSSIVTKQLNLPGIRYCNSELKDSVSGQLFGTRQSGAISTLFFYTINESDSVKERIPKGKFFIELDSPERYEFPKVVDDKYAAWSDNNYYYYELVLPLVRMDTSNVENRILIKKIMRDDLERYFNLKFVKEKRILKHWVIGWCSSVYKFQKVYHPEGVSFAQIFEDFQRVNWDEYPFPILDKTGLMNSAARAKNFVVKSSLNDLISLTRELSKYGLELKIQEIETPVWVLKSGIN